MTNLEKQDAETLKAINRRAVMRTGTKRKGYVIRGAVPASVSRLMSRGLVAFEDVPKVGERAILTPRGREELSKQD